MWQSEFWLAGFWQDGFWDGESVQVTPSYSQEVELKKWYVKRGKKVLLFNNSQEADDYLESLEIAEQAIKEAQKTSRRARARLRNKLVTVKPIESIDVELLTQAIDRFSLPSLPDLLAQQDLERFMQLLALAKEMQDDDDLLLLLL
jgi:hypothetical protein